MTVPHDDSSARCRSSSTDYATLVEHASICIHEIGLDGRLLSMNAAGLRMFDRSLEQVTGVHHLDFVAAADHDRVTALLDAARHCAVPSEFEFAVEVDGRRRHFASGFIPLVDETGRTQRLMGITQDVTDRAEAISRLEDSEQRFRDFADTAADFFWEVDADLSLVDSIGGFESAEGMASEAAAGKSIVELWADRVSGDLEPDVRDALVHRHSFDDVEIGWDRGSAGSVTVSLSGKPVHDADGHFVGFRGSGRDVTDVRAMASMLAFQASHDELTGLINRREFEARLAELLSDFGRHDHRGDEHVVCFIDLDQFKIVNDTCGHFAGDELLRQVGTILRSHVRSSDTLARLGGDEFGVIMYGCAVDHAKRVLQGILESLATLRFDWEDHVFTIGASIGVVPVTSASRNVGALFRAADTACYAAKDQGRNRIVVFHPGDEEMNRRQEEIRALSRITTAFDESRFLLYAQPIVGVDAAADRVVRRFEILTRLTDDTGEIVGPAEFLPAAERYGLVTRLDTWVVETALERLARLTRPGLEMCAINLSGASLGDEAFLGRVVDALDASDVDPGTICFEITETAAITNRVHADRFIGTLRDRGCQFALDDFGTGMASFAYLKNMPVDVVKIDGSFVCGILTDPVDLSLVRSITDIGKNLGKTIVAEWVETEEVLDRLRELDVDLVQGFLLGGPVPLDELLIPFD